MKKKWLICIVLSMLMMLGVCGCMDKGKDYKKVTDAYLKEKYAEEFEMVKLSREFSGDVGTYIRAVYLSKRYDEKFTVYCYQATSRDEDTVVMDGEKYKVSDNYAEVLFQNEYAERLKEQISDATIVKCRIIFDNYSLSKEDVDKGLEYCLNNEQFDSHAKIYVIADSEKNTEEFISKVKNVVLPYKGYMQYLYLGFVDEIDEKAFQEQYLENINSFGDYLIESELVDRVEYVGFTRKDGIVRESVEKE